MSQAPPQDQSSGHYLTANGLAIYYEEYGPPAGPPLLLLHGGTATIASWQAQIPVFATHFRVIALDSRGHGKTANPAAALTYRLMADDVAAFVQAKPLSKPLVFGYSDGGQVALELGIHYPDLAQALVLGGTAYRFPAQYFAALREFGVDPPEAGPFDFVRLAADQPEWVAELQAAHAQPDQPNNWQRLMTQIAGLWWNVQDYSVADLHQIQVSTLILLGDRDEGVAVEQAVEMYRAIPQAELAILPHANHGQLDAGANQLIADFLRRHSSPAC